LTSQGVGSFWYLPPESFQSQATITNKVDIWSMGVIFYELIFNKKPYSAVELNSKNNK
jgi:tousled-like kinase